MNESNPSDIVSFVEVLSFAKLTLLFLGLIVLVIIVKVISNLGGRLHRKIPSGRLIIAQFVTVVSFGVYIIGGVYLFYGVIQPPKALLIAVSGTLAVALGLSLKDLIASVVAGVILLFDRPFKVGDRITFENVYGEITSIGLRAVRMLTLDESVVTIPNSKFITDLVKSSNLGSLDMMVEVDFHVDPSGDIKKAKELLHEVASTSIYSYLKRPVVVSLSEVEFAQKMAIQLKVKGHVFDIRYEKALQSDFIIRGNEALKEYNIPRPQVVITS